MPLSNRRPTLPALERRLGYGYSPAWTPETGFHMLPNSSGFVVNTERINFPHIYKHSSLYIPVSVVFRVWQPVPRPAVPRAIRGGGLYLQNGQGSVTDTVRYAATPGGHCDSKLLVRKQGSTQNVSYAGEAGLWAERQASPKFLIGAEAKDLLELSSLDDNAISVTDEGSHTLVVTAHMASRRNNR